MQQTYDYLLSLEGTITIISIKIKLKKQIEKEYDM